MLVIPKGRKENLEQRANACGESVNGYLNRLIRSDLGMTEMEWKTHEEEAEPSKNESETPAI